MEASEERWPKVMSKSLHPADSSAMSACTTLALRCAIRMKWNLASGSVALAASTTTCGKTGVGGRGIGTGKRQGIQGQRAGEIHWKVARDWCPPLHGWMWTACHHRTVAPKSRQPLVGQPNTSSQPPPHTHAHTLTEEDCFILWTRSLTALPVQGKTDQSEWTLQT